MTMVLSTALTRTAIALVFVAMLLSTASIQSLLHTLIAQLQNHAAGIFPTSVAFPPSRRSGVHCSRIMPRVHLFEDVLSPVAFAGVRSALPEAARRDGLCYNTPGRRSCVLNAAQTTAVAPAVRALHHDPDWGKRLSRTRPARSCFGWTSAASGWLLPHTSIGQAHSTHLTATAPGPTPRCGRSSLQCTTTRARGPRRGGGGV